MAIVQCNTCNSYTHYAIYIRVPTHIWPADPFRWWCVECLQTKLEQMHGDLQVATSALEKLQAEMGLDTLEQKDETRE